jgi:hypothetical protein
VGASVRRPPLVKCALDKQGATASESDDGAQDAMIRIDKAQWARFEDDRRARFQQRLVKFVEDRFGRPGPDSGLRSPEEVVQSALEFSGTVGVMTEAQIARLAILLVAVNRQRLPQDRVDQLRTVLLHPDRTPDERLDGAAAFLGITG